MGLEEFFGNQGGQQETPWWEDRKEDLDLMERLRWFARSIGSWPRSEDTLQRFERRQQEYLDAGTLLYETMPQFVIHDRCPKCNSQKKGGLPPFHIHYISSFQARAECPKHAGEREHLHVGCNKCGYHYICRVKTEEDANETAWFGHQPPQPVEPP